MFDASFNAVVFTISTVALFAIGCNPLGWAMGTAAAVAWYVANDDGR